MPTSDPWDGTTWNVAAPDTDQPAGNAFKEIYDLRKGIAIRLNKEHETLAASSAGGVHKQGSARCFFQDAEPATQVNGDAFDSGDLGCLWIDSNSSPDNQFNILTATTPTWTPISTEIIAVLLASARIFGDALTVEGLLTANGGVTLGAGDDLIGSATSDITINTDKFTVAGATGNTNVGGTFESVGIATLADASVTKTTAAPGADAQIVNKKYVDDTYLAGQSVQVVNTQTGAVANGSTAIPYDDTIPQITEGTEFMTLAITPTSATNELKVEVVCALETGGVYVTAALFQDSTAGALAAAARQSNSAQPGLLTFTYYMTAGTTSATTFRVRGGASTATTTTFNGYNTARIFGGVMASSITITEIKV